MNCESLFAVIICTPLNQSQNQQK